MSLVAGYAQLSPSVLCMQTTIVTAWWVMFHNQRVIAHNRL